MLCSAALALGTRSPTAPQNMHPCGNVSPVGANTWLHGVPCMGGHSQHPSGVGTVLLPRETLQSTPCQLPTGSPCIHHPVPTGVSPEGCHTVAWGRAMAMPASLTPRVPAAGSGVQDVVPSLPAGAASPAQGGHRHRGGRAGTDALVLVKARDVRHCFINVQRIPNKEAQVGPELPARAGGSRRGWGGGQRWGRGGPVPPQGKVVVGPGERFVALNSCWAPQRVTISASLPAESRARCPAIHAGRGAVVASWAPAVGATTAVP